ncbi:methyltransferase [Ornithinimicrobium murale]|uniref:methyltransferase n=1 Tax=Ornithinimicrobium murale TaxID=1050153 RepID=UPI001EE0319E|nr:class I SAM-dependent methyltransferase [Ornithinimicrobium murale]
MTQSSQPAGPGTRRGPEPASAVSVMTFGGLRIAYDHRVLTPRPWTAQQSRWAAQLMAGAPPGGVLELCCGAGHIGLLATALTPEPARRHLVAVDINPAAMAFTVSNAQNAGLSPWVEVRHGDLTAVLGTEESFALIIADPPWVPEAETTRFPQDPLQAIDGGVDGLEVARRCLEVAQRHLAPDGALLLQLGTREQVAQLDPASYGLTPLEVRTGERGVLVDLRQARPA